MVHPLFHVQWDRCDQHNHQTYKYLMKEHIYIAESEIKGSGYLRFVCPQKHRYEVFLVRIKKVVEKRITVNTHRNATCLLEDTPVKNS